MLVLLFLRCLGAGIFLAARVWEPVMGLPFEMGDGMRINSLDGAAKFEENRQPRKEVEKTIHLSQDCRGAPFNRLRPHSPKLHVPVLGSSRMM